MSVAKIAEISAASDTSFEDAIARGIKRAKKRLKDIRCARVQDQKVDVKKGKIVRYRVNPKVTFVLED